MAKGDEKEREREREREIDKAFINILGQKPSKNTGILSVAYTVF